MATGEYCFCHGYYGALNISYCIHHEDTKALGTSVRATLCVLLYATAAFSFAFGIACGMVLQVVRLNFTDGEIEL